MRTRDVEEELCVRIASIGNDLTTPLLSIIRILFFPHRNKVNSGESILASPSLLILTVILTVDILYLCLILSR